ncbi:MAG: 50S ribosomal protein L18 [Elusimicrobiota bacterium]|jgi:large subunit ribosomal protein L18
MKDKQTRLEFRKRRVRDNIVRAANGLPRLCVRRSLRYFYAQVIDDVKGVTLAVVDSRPEKGDACKKSVKDAQAVGKMIAEKALKAGVERVVFDRGGLLYHGRIKALADAARAAGLKF